MKKYWGQWKPMGQRKLVEYRLHLDDDQIQLRCHLCSGWVHIGFYEPVDELGNYAWDWHGHHTHEGEGMTQRRLLYMGGPGWR